VLLANPGTEIPALELATGPSPAADAPATDAAAVTSRSATLQPVLDEKAVAQYRRRITALYQEIEVCDARGDEAGAAQARAERDWLQAQLRSATGPSGRVRGFPTADERARISVGKAIRRALTRITEADREVGLLLAEGVRTGQRCSYVPSG
jgi:hypothetical protein